MGRGSDNHGNKSRVYHFQNDTKNTKEVYREFISILLEKVKTQENDLHNGLD